MATTRKTYEQVCEVFKDRGYELVSKEYRNNKQKLKFICPHHPEHVQTTRYNDLMNGHGCKKCGELRTVENLREQARKQKLGIEDIRAEVEEKGFTLLSETYVSARKPLDLMCPRGHRTRTRIGDFRKGASSCRECSIEDRRAPFAEVAEGFRERGYELISTEYVNQREPLKYKCLKHPDKVRSITYGSIKRGHGCYECGIESISGKNSPHYNHELTDEAREFDRRLDPEERAWRIEVFQRDNFTCQKCGIINRSSLNAHHKDAHHWCVERRYDTTNGATLCVGCHKEFHTMFGYRNNTEEQFDEWLSGKGAIT